MLLTKLEIKGFKSFGDKIVIHFNEGVTAIVGPNGCGKSNVVDAIRWVLGEQSTKMLRSDKMENILFNGTKTRKPSNLAEVSLTFDNTRKLLPTEFSQVTITRKLYRNGDSEYRLNDVKCRLKDISDLFLDTGIGPDSYSIIELKMIDEIINNKENSRRTLFEEASGISKYKIRKKQTFSKLKDTQLDLDRVEDVLAEIDKNLKSLENQARKTTRYYKLKERYKEVSVQLAKCKASYFEQQQRQIGIELQHRQAEQQLAIDAITKKEEILLTYKNNTLTLEKNVALQQKATQEYLYKIRTYENEKKIKNEQLRHLQQAELRLNHEITQDKQQLNHVLYNLKRIEEDQLEAQTQLNTAELNLQQSKGQTEEIVRQQQRAKLHLENGFKNEQQLLQQKHHLEKELAVWRIQQEALQQEGLRNLSDTAIRETELNEFSRAKEALEVRMGSLQSDAELLEIQEQKLQEERILTQQHIEQAQQELQKESRRLDALLNEYNLTKSLVDNLEGFPESIRFIRKHAGWKKPFPLFSDVLFCKEAFRIAIENHLEPYMNHYVVDTMDEAEHAIHLLRNASRGRAHFFVLQAIQQLTQPTLPPQTNQELISVMDVIRVDDKYKKLCELLLQGVYLVPNSSEIVYEGLLPPPVQIWLHQEGKYTKNALGIGGGSVGLFEGKRIGRAKNLENLSKEIKSIQGVIHTLENELSDQKRKNTVLKSQSQHERLTTCLHELQQLKQSHLTLQTKQEQYQQFILNSQNRKVDIEQKITQIQEELRLKEPRLIQLTTELSDKSGEIRTLQEEVNALSELVSEQNSQLNQDTLRFHQLKNKVSGLLKDKDYRESQQQAHADRLDKNTRDLTRTLQQIKDILLHADHNDEDLIQMYREKETLENGLKELQEIYQHSRQLINETEENLVHLRRQKEMADTFWLSIKEQSNQLQMEIQRVTERLSVEFQLDFDQLVSDEKIPFELELEPEYAEKVEKARKQLDEFGSINPLAMEAYHEMNERSNFIIKEKQDLLEAKGTLLETIEEIDVQAKRNFMEAFDQVRVHFINVFRSLFNKEDSCDLILTDPEHPLESDIDIIARPKGKRPLSINQLSGGEKTLTSTALLFSLYLLKPAPFCIFDEVDAPLDDTNIDKFNNIIREFSGQSQFIVVSHNKRTIASTDIIYGVTMIEQGVSKVVAVDLRDVA